MLRLVSRIVSAAISTSLWTEKRQTNFSRFSLTVADGAGVPAVHTATRQSARSRYYAGDIHAGRVPGLKGGDRR